LIERIASPRGAVCGLALDHRDSLRVAARRHGYPEDTASLRALKVELVHGLARLGPDVLKLQYPGSARLCEVLTRACGAVPWVLLGGGTDEDTFLTQLRDAMRAGARGYIVGRTAWDAALNEDELEQRSAIAERAAFLARAVQVAEEG
jgi:tagatose-1,6-bisphosphate aldolase